MMPRAAIMAAALSGLVGMKSEIPEAMPPRLTVLAPRRRRRKHRTRVRTDNKTLRRFRVATASGRSWKVVRGATP